MIYLTDEDLHAHIQIRLRNESESDFITATDTIELQNIELIKSYLSDKYNVALIFLAGGPVYNGLLKKILTHLVLYDLVRRNAARKVPEDYKDDYKWAIAQLEKINAGKITLDNLPGSTDENGVPFSDSIWGNNTNPNFYL